MAAPKKGRRAPSSQGRPWRALTVLLVGVVALTGGMFLSGHTTPRLGIDLAGGTSITLTARSEPGKENAINETNMNTAVSIMERRVNGLGVAEAEVRTQGDENIVINIPRGTDEKQAREQVGTTAQLAFRPVLSLAPAAPPQAEPTASPSGSPTGSAEADEEARDGEQDEKAGEPSATSSSGAPDQGRAVTDDLKADASETPEASAPADDPSASPGATGPAEGAEDPAAPDAGIPADLQKKLDALDCSTQEKQIEASREAALAKDSESVVTCDESGQFKYALGPVAVPGTDVTDAASVFDDQRGQGWIVTMEFDKDGAKKFADITEQLSTQTEPRNQFAIVLDGEVVSAPRVSERLGGGSAEISGSFTQQSSEELANILSYGALPLSFEESNVTTISPTLGSEQLKAGLIAGAIGLALVIAYLIFYYRVLGLVAIASLVAAAILTYAVMTLLGPAIGFALSLPAVCGAIVAIGITADSFIVYFERIRDEIREGRSIRAAFQRAWPSARRTILVSDLVSIIAATVLFIVSVGSVQGFAFVLGLTTALDLAIVFLLTKPLMTILAGRKFFVSGHPWSGLDPKRLGVTPPLRRGRRTAAVPAEPKEA
ncbi:protein translocase subunit SecD [Streptomyces sp. TRM 70361]|uniref:protein translocase subunit SecD n=1 Tax=Streptomyces sp. TRM 70361 TaxID=3116553 RepID=UPI002E7BDF8C|nr:protein translocase subunit SecD [Streptomyces sp. TRM 70361]MEE1939058.1 protein translocase subunit SecD [Streptomyces sp. TRM 70361]